MGIGHWAMGNGQWVMGNEAFRCGVRWDTSTSTRRPVREDASLDTCDYARVGGSSLDTEDGEEKEEGEEEGEEDAEGAAVVDVQDVLISDVLISTFFCPLPRSRRRSRRRFRNPRASMVSVCVPGRKYDTNTMLPPSSWMLLLLLVTLVLFLLSSPPRTWVALAPLLFRARGASSSARVVLVVPLATAEVFAEARPEGAEGGAAAASSLALMALASLRRRVLSEVGAGLAPELLREPLLVCPARCGIVSFVPNFPCPARVRFGRTSFLQKSGEELEEWNYLVPCGVKLETCTLCWRSQWHRIALRLEPTVSPNQCPTSTSSTASPASPVAPPPPRASSPRDT